MYPEHHLVKNGSIEKCQVCNSTKLHLVLDLGHQPLCCSVVTKEKLNEPEVTYPLRMYWCEECSVVQLDYCVDNNILYPPQNYTYKTGITKELVEYLHNMSKSLVSKYNLKSDDLVVDIGSNDGTLLNGFKNSGVRVLGVEPTNIAETAVESGINTIKKFFDVEVAGEIKEKYSQASLITATNVFAHMATIGEVILGLETLLKDDGVFVSETHYLLDVVQGGQFDTIYHEHLRTYSLKSLIRLFSYYNFTITDVERGSRYGGNIRIHATKGKNRPISDNVTRLLDLEEKAGLYKLETYMSFANRVNNAKKDFISFILKIKEEGKSVLANSCPTRAVTLLNYYGVGRDFIPFIAEQPTSLRLGLYLPGKHIPIVNNEILIKEQPNYVILLAWHYAEPIMEQLKARGLKSNFIIPLPDLKVVEN